MWHPESGTKLILEDPQGRILACLRDNDPTIPYPGKWDLPGGGVEPHETLLECGHRELFEEFGLQDVPLAMLDQIESRCTPGKIMGRAWGRLTAVQVGSIAFGPEGQRYDFFSVPEIAELDFVPQLQEYVLTLHGLANRVKLLERTA